MSNTTSKSWKQSKTLFFNVLIAILAVLVDESNTLKALLSDRGDLALLLIIAVGNAVLRFHTDTAIKRK